MKVNLNFILSFFLVCGISAISICQKKDTLTFNYLKDNAQKLNYLFPYSADCSYLKDKEKNYCFITSIESLLLRDLHYPIKELMAGTPGKATVEIIFSNFGTVINSRCLSSTNQNFELAALNATNNLPSFEPARIKKKTVPFKLVYTFNFNPKTWRNKPANVLTALSDYYSTCDGLDSTLFKQVCDSCVTHSSIYKHYQSQFLNDLDSALAVKQKLLIPTSGHVFSKYKIDPSGKIILDSFEFENTTTISQSALKEVFESMTFLTSLNLDYSKVKNQEYELVIYFNKNGLSLPSDPENQEERMPVLGEKCKQIKDKGEQAKCTELAIMTHIGKNTTYPEAARQRGETGRVFVQFIVGITGYLEEISILKGVSETIDNAALEVIKKLPRMEPAMQRGKPVKLKYTIPVNFNLN